ncbi:MAG: tRNA lysidine(34) synthetase TilS, partial [candidate division Zixibacteria bacterium]|nr:tRNA lysidine(34) synthetase TilS [candidate division Zixibacteria bacterium]
MSGLLQQKMISTIKRHKLLQKGDRVLVACSGGPDSVALFHLLLGLKVIYRLDLCLAHVNHTLRGRQSDADERFVREMARKYEIKFFTRKVDVKKLASREHLSLEEAARVARYEYFEKLAIKHRFDKIATGHTQDDQAETVLMRFLRGAGVLGLSGIPVRRGKIIRPLLEVSRDEVAKYLKSNRISYRVDKSNQESDFLRNRIRHDLLPLLKEQYNPNLTKVLSRTAGVLSDLDGMIQKQVTRSAKKSLFRTGDNRWRLNLQRFRGLPEPIKSELIRHAWHKVSGKIYPLEYEQVERVLRLADSAPVGKRVNLKLNYGVEKDRAYLSFFRSSQQKVTGNIPREGKVRFPKLNFEICSKVLNRRYLPKEIFSPSQETAYLDLDKFTSPPRLRNWVKGESFRPLGMKGHKKISDFLTDLKMDRFQKEQVPVVSSNGKIAWVVGQRISEEFKIRPESKRVLRLQV